MEDCVLPVMNTGLRGVDVASSKICDVKGKQGKLIYRGFLIEDLAQNAGFEEVCFLLSDRGILKGKKECFWSNHNATYICGSGFKSRV